MDFQPSARSQDYTARVRRFIEDHIDPIEKEYERELASANRGGDWKSWQISPIVEALKARARAEGLWNLFLPEAELGAGLSTLEYAPVAEAMGRSLMAAEVFNCDAPDSGNMEVLWRYGTPEQQQRWLVPLLAGEIRSAFCMTEPDVASSDATNMQATAVIEGGEVVINARKWWATGIGHPKAAIAIVMARTADAQRDRHHQHSMVLVPMDTPGVRIRRMLSVYGGYHEPHGHGEVHFDNARVPLSNFIRGPGAGFEIAQGRLGPGRIHHSMRCLGAAERALELAIARGHGRVAFGKSIIDLGGNRERIAEARMAIDQARLLTLYAAWKMDSVGTHAAMSEIAAIKVIAPRVLSKVVDEAIQMHGAAGICQDTVLPALFAHGRMLRIADGPDEVHKALIARFEIARHRHPTH